MGGERSHHYTIDKTLVKMINIFINLGLGIRILFFRPRLNILIFLPFLGFEYSCKYSLIILGIQSGPCQHNDRLSHCPIMTLMALRK